MEKVFEDGVVGHYLFCEVTQIVLYDKQEKEYWNYFTNIYFSKSFIEGNDEQWLTSKPISINSRFQVMIKKQVLPAQDAANAVDMAVESQLWKYGDDCARLLFVGNELNSTHYSKANFKNLYSAFAALFVLEKALMDMIGTEDDLSCFIDFSRLFVRRKRLTYKQMELYKNI